MEKTTGSFTDYDRLVETRAAALAKLSLRQPCDELSTYCEAVNGKNHPPESRIDGIKPQSGGISSRKSSSLMSIFKRRRSLSPSIPNMAYVNTSQTSTADARPARSVPTCQQGPYTSAKYA